MKSILIIIMACMATGGCDSKDSGSRDGTDLAGDFFEDMTTDLIPDTDVVNDTVEDVDQDVDMDTSDPTPEDVPTDEDVASVCQEQSAENPLGRPRLQQQAHSSGIFQVVMEDTAVWLEVDPSDAGSSEAAASFDMTAAGHETAAFVVARSPMADHVLLESRAAAERIASIPGFRLTVLADGVQVISHDGFDTLVRVVLWINSSSSVALGQLRNELIVSLMDRSTADFPVFSTELMGVMGMDFVASFMVQRRNSTQALVMGAVALLDEYASEQDIRRHVDDTAGGTGLASAGAVLTTECETLSLDSPPKADLIWVVDDSGGFVDDQHRIASAGTDMLGLADRGGMDWRMCVVDMTEENPGSCCTNSEESNDYWLGPAETTNFFNCILDPAGQYASDAGFENGLLQMEDAVNTHLPRSAADPQKIRPDSTLAVIFASDEPSQELKDESMCPISESSVTDWSAECEAIVQHYADFLDAEQGKAYGLLVPAMTPNCSDLGDWGRGYEELIDKLGGQEGSICQNELIISLKFIMLDIACTASSLAMGQVPIAAGLAAAMENKTSVPSTLTPLPRSLQDGFWYCGPVNSLLTMGRDIGDPPYEIVVGYSRWVP